MRATDSDTDGNGKCSRQKEFLNSWGKLKTSETGLLSRVPFSLSSCLPACLPPGRQASLLLSLPLAFSPAADAVIKNLVRAPVRSPRFSDQKFFQVSFCVAKDDNSKSISA